jgi:hypothetical protein
MSEGIKVFVSYSHDSPEHMSLVLAFSDALRQAGIETVLDQYVLSPSEGWPRCAGVNRTGLVAWREGRCDEEGAKRTRLFDKPVLVGF